MSELTDHEDKEVQQVYDSFWKELLETNGQLDTDKVKSELFDYRTILGEVCKVYDELTMGRFTKPNTRAECIIDAVRELQESDDAELKAEIKLLRSLLQQAFDTLWVGMGKEHLQDITATKKAIAKALGLSTGQEGATSSCQ